ncbi:MAG TPA: glycosyltransferase family 2 protein [Lachnospiraceae bacterium]|nr:glycosyltransferase family 2 protein [Lachnospiraceae bacterium]HEX3075928.1 glycosyltransferase family 2 protein [Lachnospiraceae bacterium]
MDKHGMSVDIIIPTYRPDDEFYILIEKLLRQTVSSQGRTSNDTFLNKILIINTEAQYFDETKLESDERIEVIHITKPEFDHGGTRNHGASLSHADIIMFMTQDAMPKDTYLVENLTKPLMMDNVAVSYARQLPNEKSGTIERYTRSFNYPSTSSFKSKEDIKTLGIKTYFCSNVCAAYKRDIYLSLNGFVTKTIFNEDMIMASKVIDAGYKIAYVAEAKVIHSHKYTYRQQFTRNFDLAVSQKQYEEIFSKVKSESEGIKLVKQTASYLCRKGKVYLLPDLILQSGFKFLGYKMGYRYDRLSPKMVRRLSMNKSYWDKREAEKVGHV